MPFEIYEGLSTRILKNVANVDTVIDHFVGVVIPIIEVGLALQIVLHGYRVIRGEGGQHHFLDVFSRSLRAFLVLALALTGNMYEQNVHQFIVGLGNDVLVGFGGAEGLTKYQQIDLAMTQGLAAFDAVVAWGNDHINIGFIYVELTGILAILAGTLMILIILLLGVIACAELLIIDFGLYIIFGVGPLFVACYAFEATARYFDTWFASALKWTFTAVVIMITVLMSVKLLQDFVYDISTAGNLKQIMLVILSASAAAVVLIMIVMRAPAIASDLVGGTGLNGVAGSIKSAVSNGIKTSVKTVLKGGLYGVKKTGGAVAGAFRKSSKDGGTGEDGGGKGKSGKNGGSERGPGSDALDSSKNHGKPGNSQGKSRSPVLTLPPVKK
ncbi:type IV secretion system protein [Janthinobacterium violaceinigrum]|uniref:Conjugal transfer protein TrbL n=1 Tax=Janthinobacterium violaceinigrum TaxID=2654252 RepID=A0A6I1I9Z6_9BURK|nr:type IV secretion system protein [Janthinobacterium violaceinigrum]KAB8065266.1 hypothetical protein GCN75_09705 [Janthinobacterium violaceinigrum]